MILGEELSMYVMPGKTSAYVTQVMYMSWKSFVQGMHS